MKNLIEKIKAMEPKKRIILISSIVGALLLLLILILVLALSGKGKDKDRTIAEEGTKEVTTAASGTERGENSMSSTNSPTKAGNDTAANVATTAARPAETQATRPVETTAAQPVLTGDKRLDNLNFRKIPYTGTPTGTFTTVGMPDERNYLGKYGTESEVDLNSYRITFAYDDLGMEHIAGYKVNEKNRISDCYDGMWWDKNDGFYNEKLKAAMTDQGADLMYMTVAQTSHSDYDDLITMHVGIIHADSEADLPKNVINYRRALYMKIYRSNYTDRADMYNHYAKTKVMEYLDDYQGRKVYEGTWDGELFSDEVFDVTSDGVKQRYRMSLSNTTGEREYVDFNGDPGYIDTHIIREAWFDGEVDYCNIVRMVWLGGEEGTCAELKFLRIPLRYKDHFVKLMASLQVKDFATLESEEDKRSSVLKCTMFNDFILRVEYDGKIVRGREKEDGVAAMFVNDHMQTSSNKVQLNINNVYANDMYIVIKGYSTTDYEMQKNSWLDEQRFSGNIHYVNKMPVYEVLKVNEWGYYVGYNLIIPLPDGAQVYDGRGNEIDFIYANVYLQALRNENGTYSPQIALVEEWFEDLLSHVHMSIEGTLGNEEWRDTDYVSYVGDGATYMFEK